jgi:hypothetical protein
LPMICLKHHLMSAGWRNLLLISSNVSYRNFKTDCKSVDRLVVRSIDSFSGVPCGVFN